MSDTYRTSRQADPREGEPRGHDMNGPYQTTQQADPREGEPRGHEPGWERVDRRTAAVSAVYSLAVVAPIVLAMSKFLADRDVPPAGIVAANAATALLVIGATVAYDVVRWRKTVFRVTAGRVEQRSGVFVRTHLSIPRDRIRSVDITADPVRRVLGLATVTVGSGEHAGAEGSELRLDPLTKDRAEELRRTLLDRGERSRQEQSAEGDPALATLRWSWVRFAPLTVWSLVGALVAAGAVYKALDLIGLNLLSWDVTRRIWQELQEMPLWVAVLLVAGAATAVGTLGALALFAETWAGYRLEREAGGTLRVRRGLLTRKSLSLEERRLRGVEIAEPLLLRTGGGARVRVVATGLGAPREDQHEQVDALTPPMPRATARLVAAHVLRTDPAAAFDRLSPHPPAARRRRYFTALVCTGLGFVAVAVLDTLFTWTPAWAWAVPALTAPVALALATGAYRGLGHGLTGRHLIVRSGVLARRTVALDRAGVIGWQISRSPLQRRSGLLTIRATTAAGKGVYELADVGTDQGLTLAAAAVPGLLSPFVERTGPPPPGG
ncbi:PH domain-containing protein [Sinosporangium siamense]|uniref:YdbS-like PH domain-containing protein n=1 Tax=Sinosporangium siamense TaxID=1367973 RepID=A0A919V9J4_9ACTN|nr:PH domain-containing protein [Sinosporangium siamense]GII90199.1 hypothetical protein Ssi02_04300 [Sinosporangium siamense]